MVNLTPDPPLAYTFVDDGRPGFFADVWQRFFVQLKTFLGFIPAGNVAWTPVDKAFADTGYITAEGELVAVDASGGATTILLPSAPAIVGSPVVVKKIDGSGHAVTVDGNGATIDGAGTHALVGQWNAATIAWTGAAWLITGQV